MSALSALPAHGQAGEGVAVITGRVVSAYGDPLVTEVTIRDMGISVRSAPDGNYRMVVPAARVAGQPVVLQTRLPGYAPETQALVLHPGAQTADFVLRRDVNRLTEVVIVGAVTATAQNKLAYSVATLDTADFLVSSVNPLQGIQAKIPGAMVFQPSGRPGGSPTILLRGPKSINGAGRSQEPLIIVDGAIINGGTQDINPDDIATVEVIKGAAATTLYGSRAGAGVIQITTKSASLSSGTRVGVRSEFGFNDVQGTWPFATRHTLMLDETGRHFCVRVTGQPTCSRVVDFEEETRRINDVYSSWALLPQVFERDFTGFGAGRVPSKPELRSTFQVNRWPRSYNPVEQVLTSGAFSMSNADVSARTDGTGFYGSLSHLAQEGALRYQRGYRRSSMRANVDQELQEDLRVDLNATFARGTLFPVNASAPFGTDASSEESIFSLTRTPPGVNLLRRDQLGRLYIRSNPLTTGRESTNPLYGYENIQGQQGDDRFLGSLAMNYSPTAAVTFDATISADRRRMSEWGYLDRDYRTVDRFGQIGGGTQGMIDEKAAADLSHNVMLSGRADFRHGSDLRGAVVARYSYEAQEREASSTHGDGLLYPRLVTINNATTNIRSQSERWRASAIGVIGGIQLDYKDRYIFDGLARHDGSSLFGADERWHPYYRGSFAWRASDEDFWPFRGIVNDLKVRTSVGTAGGRPNFAAQYETFNVVNGAVSAASTLGNRRLKPEHTLETEYGFDAELMHAVGVSLTYARDITRDQLLAVPAPVASGHTKQWQNAGTLDGRSWELSVRLPVLETRDLTWTAQLGWDRQRTWITSLNTLPFFQDLSFRVTPGLAANGYQFYIAPGERLGTMYGRRFATSCSELPAPFNAQCGPGQEWQHNDEGYVVWVGEGNSWRDGVTQNLWQAVRRGCLKDGAVLASIGEVECLRRGGTVNAPWGVPETSWGMPTVLRDSTATPIFVPLGNTMPDYRITLSQSVQWRRLSLYALVDAARGNMVFNSERRWALGDFMAREQDQQGKTVETAKPIGYYWRGFLPPQTGVGGFYNDNRASNHSLEDGSYTKLREVRIAYDLQRLPGVAGMWTVALAGRNLYTWTRYTGFDPEVGTALVSADGGAPNSPAITTGGQFQYPPMRTFTFTLSARF